MKERPDETGLPPDPSGSPHHLITSSPHQPPRWLRASLQASTIGLTLIAATFIGFGIGLLLDRLFHTGFSHGRGVGWLTLLFSVLGVIAGFREMFRTVIRISEDEDRSAQ